MSEAKTDLYAGINRRRALITAIAGLFVLLAAVIDLGVGSSGIGVREVVEALLAGPNGSLPSTPILWSIRLPMTLTCIAVGGALGLAGLQVQTITNNALASPYTLGITAGASFGAAIAITLGLSVGGLLWVGTASLAFLFAIGVSMAIFLLGKLKGMSTTTLVLAGIVMNFFFQALQQLMQYRASAEIAQIIASWTFGNLSRSTWTSAAVNGIILAAGLLLLSRWSWQLTALGAGEERAASLGVNVERLKFRVFVVSALLIAGAVGFIGTVAFVGLVSPHCARMLLGEEQRFLLPVSTLLGSALVLVSSILSKLLSTGSMLPVGIITSIVGVPFLFVLLLRKGG